MGQRDPAVDYNMGELAHALFEETSDALVLFDPETEQIVEANPAVQRMTGFPRAELLRMQATQLFGSEKHGSLHLLRQAYRRTGFFHSQDGYFLRCSQNGVWIPVNLTITRLHILPRIMGLINARDVREQHEAQSRLQKLEAEYRQVITSISDCIWSAEVSGNRWWYRFISPVIELITGRPAEFFQEGRHRWADLIHPEDRHIWDGIPGKLGPGLFLQERYRILRPDGGIRWVRDSINVSPGPQAGSLRLDGVLADITDRKQAETALRHSEERYRSVVEGSIQGIAIHLQGQMQYVNPTLARIFGYGAAEELVGRNVWESLALPDHRAALEARSAACQRGDHNPDPVIWQGVRKDGSQLWIESANTVIPWHDQSAILSFLTDITERRRLEEQFRQAQKMEIVGRLAGGIAHDFNNLMTVVLGTASLLLEGQPGPNSPRDGLLAIKRAGERAAQLTRQLLAFSRKQILMPRVFQLNAIIRDMQAVLQRLIGEDIVLTADLAPTLGQVRADPGQIEQVILNLIINSRDAMPEGGTLTIETANVALDEAYALQHLEVQPGPYVKLSITDTGCGMSPEVLAHLFEPFFTTKEVGKGTGLGLATVFGIVKQSDGHIEVASVPGEGTTFHIFLPRVAGEPTGPEPEVHSMDLDVGSETILLVEDEESVRGMIRVVLTQSGYAVLDARDGAEAIEKSRQASSPIHLLLTDVVMPQMSGRELATRLRQSHPRLKVMFMSGYPDNVVFREGSWESEVRLLHKPFAPAILMRMVRECLDEG